MALVLALGSTAATAAIPYIEPQQWLPAIDYQKLEYKTVEACCRTAEQCAVQGTTCSTDPTDLVPVEIGRMPQFQTSDTLQVLEVARKAWNGGSGEWTQMTHEQRLVAMERFFAKLSERRQEIVEVLMWEIGKNRPDAEAEFDRTVDFAKQVMYVLRTDSAFTGKWQTIGSTTAFVKRAAIGVYLTLAPYNYPLNECYAAIIPCLLLGNVVILKIPTIGGLAHLLTMQAFAEALPPGTINFIAGGGRATMPPLMETGLIDGLAFIGSSQAADDLIARHPHPHRLKVFLQLEANNMAIYLPDLFEAGHEEVLAHAVDQAVVGSLSYNGQRCTALKLHFVPSAHAQVFVDALVDKIQALSVGLPDEQDAKGKYSAITPLPSTQRIEYMKALIDDALSKGAKIMNKGGGELIGGELSTLMVPAVLFPVTPDMRLYHEEQFGPVVPVTTYDDLEQVIEFGQEGPFGQQVSVFGQDPTQASQILDRLSAVFGKINLNSQCGRSPDTLPFSGRRSSAMGVMSVEDALREFSVPTVVAYKDDKFSPDLAKAMETQSNFLQPAAAIQ